MNLNYPYLKSAIIQATVITIAVISTAAFVVIMAWKFVENYINK